MLIREIDVINIHYGEQEHQVWVKTMGQEMALDPSLDDLPEVIDLMRMSRTNPGLRECLDRAIMYYRLAKP